MRQGYATPAQFYVAEFQFRYNNRENGDIFGTAIKGIKAMSRIHRFVAFVWLIFAVLFFGMALFHWHLSGQSAPDLVPMSLNGCQNGVCIQNSIGGVSIDRPLNDFADKFNEYVHRQNATSHSENLAAMGGYLLAGLTALLSLYLEIAAIREKNREVGEDRSPQT
jgi:hypothetical protein